MIARLIAASHAERHIKDEPEISLSPLASPLIAGTFASRAVCAVGCHLQPINCVGIAPLLDLGFPYGRLLFQASPSGSTEREHCSTIPTGWSSPVNGLQIIANEVGDVPKIILHTAREGTLWQARQHGVVGT